MNFDDFITIFHIHYFIVHAVMQHVLLYYVNGNWCFIPYFNVLYAMIFSKRVVYLMPFDNGVP